ncbi:protein SGT1 homolog isoform X2 [Symphalangus syndactylus]|uniref:protein SGT1 homolog isoform X2 n=1 Tax=Symphalangus syndactylus TaxID=9590 RepID=UPI002442AC17|nr:protein SGT1 homolog isoform X3 [Symphalangus syndactylus]
MAPRPLSLGRVPASALADAARLPTLSELTKALEQKPDDAQYYRQRAYCHILLGNYCGNFSYKVQVLISVTGLKDVKKLRMAQNLRWG